MMKAIHKLLILVSSREKAFFVRTRAARPIPLLRLHLHTILLLFYLISKYIWIHEYVTRKCKNWENLRIMGAGIIMQLLIAVQPHLVASAFYKEKHKAICIPVAMQNMFMHNIFLSYHEIPLKTQISTCKKELFTFLPQKQLTNLFVNIKAHLLPTNNTYIPLLCLLVGNLLPDALCDLLEVFKEIGCMAYLLMWKRCLSALWDCSYNEFPRHIAFP
jgi:hypothetical protein